MFRARGGRFSCSIRPSSRCRLEKGSPRSPTSLDPDALVGAGRAARETGRAHPVRQRDGAGVSDADPGARGRQGRRRHGSDRPDEGRQEQGRASRSEGGARARRRGARQVPGLVRRRGAAGAADRDRRGRSAGIVPTRDRRVEGHLLSDHRRGRAEFRHAALPREPGEQSQDRARNLPDRQRRRNTRTERPTSPGRSRSDARAA